VHNICVNFGR